MTQFHRALWTDWLQEGKAPTQRRAYPEFAECKAYVEWANLQWWGRHLHHSPNEEMDKTQRQLAAAHGTRAGFPDFVLYVRAGRWNALAFEMKAPSRARQGARALTSDQRDWLVRLHDQGMYVGLCFSALSAIELTEDFLKESDRRVDSTILQ